MNNDWKSTLLPVDLYPKPQWTPEDMAAVEQKYGIKVGSRVFWNAKGTTGNSQVHRRRKYDTGPAVVEHIKLWAEPAKPSVRLCFPNGRHDTAYIDEVEPAL